MSRGGYGAALPRLREAILISQTNGARVSEYRDRLFLVRALDAAGSRDAAGAELTAVDRLIAQTPLGPEWISIAAKIEARGGRPPRARQRRATVTRTRRRRAKGRRGAADDLEGRRSAAHRARVGRSSSREARPLTSAMHAARLVPRARDVLHVGSGIHVQLRVGAALAAELEDAVAQAAQECAVVRHEQHRPVEILERVEQHLLGRQIEMIRRLVEHEKIRRVEQHPREHQTRFLAARERANLLVDLVAGKLKRAGEVSERADRFVGKV